MLNTTLGKLIYCLVNDRQIISYFIHFVFAFSHLPC